LNFATLAQNSVPIFMLRFVLHYLHEMWTYTFHQPKDDLRSGVHKSWTPSD